MALRTPFRAGVIGAFVSSLALALLVVVLAFAFQAGLASAAVTITVDTAGDPGAPNCGAGHPAGTCSLRGAVAAAAAGNTVAIAAGINPVLTTGQVVINKNLTID